MAPRQAPLKAGVYAPIVTLFHQNNEDLDVEAQKKHAVRLAKGGLVGLVAMGSNGEAVHLTPAERVQVIEATASALDEAGFKDVPVIAGCSEQSVRGSVMLCNEAAQAGASYAMILPPFYYRPFSTDNVIYAFYKDIADKSPIPLILYSYPGASAGVDMSSDLMNRICAHPNITGVKFTCANTGKLTRVATAQKAISATSQGSGFLAAGGMSDMTVQTMVSGGSGVIAGTANVIPKFCVQVWDLCVQGKMAEAIEKQKLLAHADWLISRTGIAGTKAALHEFVGYGGLPRKPLPALTAAQTEDLLKGMAESFDVERRL